MDAAPAGTTELRALHAEHAPAISAFVLHATHDPQATEEIVQDTFLNAWRAMDRFDPQRGEIRTWLFSIARNLIIDSYRRRDARPSTPVPNERLDRADPTTPDLDRAMEAWQVSDALDQLSPAHRDAITQIHLRGRSVAEAAEALGVPPGTVKSRVYYGLRALRLALEESGAVR